PGSRGVSPRPAPRPGGQGTGQRPPRRALPALTAARIGTKEKGVVMAGQITLTEQEARALSSLLDRASDRLATYEEQTHQDRRLAEEIREAAGDPVNPISRAGATASPPAPAPPRRLSGSASLTRVGRRRASMGSGRGRVARGPGPGPARRGDPGPPDPGRLPGRAAGPVRTSRGGRPGLPGRTGPDPAPAGDHPAQPNRRHGDGAGA